ncbi:YceI family protein [Komagataeibacter oboediens]
MTATSVVPAGTDGAAISGNLTLHGVTSPMVLQVHYVGTGVNPLNSGQYREVRGDGHTPPQ